MQEVHNGNVSTSLLSLNRQAGLDDISQPKTWRSIFESSGKAALDVYLSTLIHFPDLEPGSISKAGDASFHSAFDAAFSALLQDSNWCCRWVLQHKKHIGLQNWWHPLMLKSIDFIFIHRKSRPDQAPHNLHIVIFSTTSIWADSGSRICQSIMACLIENLLCHDFSAVDFPLTQAMVLIHVLIEIDLLKNCCLSL